MKRDVSSVTSAALVDTTYNSSPRPRVAFASTTEVLHNWQVRMLDHRMASLRRRWRRGVTAVNRYSALSCSYVLSALSSELRMARKTHKPSCYDKGQNDSWIDNDWSVYILVFHFLYFSYCDAYPFCLRITITKYFPYSCNLRRTIPVKKIISSFQIKSILCKLCSFKLQTNLLVNAVISNYLQNFCPRREC